MLFGQMLAPFFPNPEFNHPTTGPRAARASPGAVVCHKETRIGRTPTDEGIGMETSVVMDRNGVVSLPLVDEARSLWEGWRSMEEYAREVFPVEEEANGLDWMLGDSLL